MRFSPNIPVHLQAFAVSLFWYDNAALIHCTSSLYAFGCSFTRSSDAGILRGFCLHSPFEIREAAVIVWLVRREEQ